MYSNRMLYIMKDTMRMVMAHHHAYPTAQENMRWDADYWHTMPPHHRMERCYIWPIPSLTYSYKQACPVEWQGVDHAARVTGGGIVFHSPKDIVLSIAGGVDDPDYPTKSKEKLAMVSNYITMALQDVGVCLDASPSSSVHNPEFCATYNTPFEQSVDGKKIVGLTIRTSRHTWLIQGIIHTAATHPMLPVNLTDRHSGMGDPQHIMVALGQTLFKNIPKK